MFCVLYSELLPFHLISLLCTTLKVSLKTSAAVFVSCLETFIEKICSLGALVHLGLFGIGTWNAIWKHFLFMNMTFMSEIMSSLFQITA